MRDPCIRLSPSSLRSQSTGGAAAAAAACSCAQYDSAVRVDTWHPNRHSSARSGLSSWPVWQTRSRSCRHRGLGMCGVYLALACVCVLCVCVLCWALISGQGMYTRVCSIGSSPGDHRKSSVEICVTAMGFRNERTCKSGPLWRPLSIDHYAKYTRQREWTAHNNDIETNIAVGGDALYLSDNITAVYVIYNVIIGV